MAMAVSRDVGKGWQAEVDARGLVCPLPLLHAKRRMASLESGQALRVLATDPEAPIDIAAWCEDEGHVLLSDRKADGFVELVVQKAPG